MTYLIWHLHHVSGHFVTFMTFYTTTLPSMLLDSQVVFSDWREFIDQTISWAWFYPSITHRHRAVWRVWRSPGEQRWWSGDMRLVTMTRSADSSTLEWSRTGSQPTGGPLHWRLQFRQSFSSCWSPSSTRPSPSSPSSWSSSSSRLSSCSYISTYTGLMLGKEGVPGVTVQCHFREHLEIVTS